MKKQILLLFGILLLMIQLLNAQNTTSVSVGQKNEFNFQNDSLFLKDSIASDTVKHFFSYGKDFGLLDTLSNDTLLEVLFKPYMGIRNLFYERTFTKLRRSIPTVKEIFVRKDKDQDWKFWTIISILFYIAFVRIVNPNNFREFILSVFNLKLSQKIWEDQRSLFGFVMLQLFAIYIFIAALFISNWVNIKHFNIIGNDINLFFLIVALLFAVYIGKFIMHAFFGYILQMKKLGIGFVSNTISVNNFIALVILPLLVFLIYNDNTIIRTILYQAILVTFFLSVVYRIVRIMLLSNSFFSFPKIYLFIYLCALEVLPWFIIIKYLNRFQI